MVGVFYESIEMASSKVFALFSVSFHSSSAMDWAVIPPPKYKKECCF